MNLASNDLEVYATDAISVGEYELVIVYQVEQFSEV